MCDWHKSGTIREAESGIVIPHKKRFYARDPSDKSFVSRNPQYQP